MEVKPEVSIVVAVYNAEKFLSKCLDSLLGQTYNNIEVICVNDASTDSSQCIINDYMKKDSRVRSIVHKENMNAGGAMNDGIKAAQGRYVCIVDNDDFLVPQAIEKLVTASENGAADLVAGDWYRFFSEDNKIYNKNLPDDLSYDSILSHVCFKGFRLLGCLWKKTIFTANNLFFPECVFFEDVAIGKTLICYGARNVRYVQEPLYYYTMLPTSVTAKMSRRKISDRLTTIGMFLDNLKKHGFYTSHKSLFDFNCLRYTVGNVELMSQYPYKEVKNDLNRNIQLVNSCLPNEFYHKLTWLDRWIVKHQRCAFWVLKPTSHLLPIIRKILRPIVHMLRSLKRCL